MSESGSQQPKTNFLERFVQVFSMHSYFYKDKEGNEGGNKTYAYLAAHCILGQVLKNVKIYIGANYIDPRISMFIMQASGTGKSVGWEIIKPVAQKAGIFADEIDEATDAALIGSQSQEEVLDPESKTRTVVYDKVEGKLATAEILHYDEGETLMLRSEHARNTLNYFEKALNPIGCASNTLSKRLGHVEFEIHPICSLIITSYPVQDVVETILHKGFFQRIVLFPRDVEVEERSYVEHMRASKLGKREFTELDITALGEELNQIRAKYGSFKFELNDDNLVRIIDSKIKALFDSLNNSHPKVQEIMYTFLPRYDNLMYIFAFHNMCNRYGDKLEAQDINYAFDKVYNLFHNLIVWVEETVDFLKLNNKEQAYLSRTAVIYRHALQNNPECTRNCPEGYVYKLELAKLCMKSWHVSRSTVLKYFRKFVGLGSMQEKVLGNVTYVRVV